MGGDATVAEIQPKEVGIVRREPVEAMPLCPALLAESLRPRDCVRVRKPSLNPVADRRTGNSDTTRNLTVVQAVLM
jgi:hypothetical protein